MKNILRVAFYEFCIIWIIGVKGVPFRKYIAYEATVGVVLYDVTSLDYVYVVKIGFWGSLAGGHAQLQGKLCQKFYEFVKIAKI